MKFILKDLNHPVISLQKELSLIKLPNERERALLHLYCSQQVKKERI